MADFDWDGPNVFNITLEGTNVVSEGTRIERTNLVDDTGRLVGRAEVEITTVDMQPRHLPDGTPMGEPPLERSHETRVIRPIGEDGEPGPAIGAIERIVGQDGKVTTLTHNYGPGTIIGHESIGMPRMRPNVGGLDSGPWGGRRLTAKELLRWTGGEGEPMEDE